MDNRITKRRLSDFLAYDWILMIVAIMALIFLWEVIFTSAATRLSVGQKFKIYRDEGLYASDNTNLIALLGAADGENGKTFSYDVLSVESESLTSSYNVLPTRMSVRDGDAIFTSSVETDGVSRVRTIIDDYPVCDFNELKENAKAYLNQFVVENGDIYNENDYDEAKIRAYFNERMDGDKRFKTEDALEKGRRDEIGRIKLLAKNVKDFEKLLAYENQDIFYKYIRYEQAHNSDPEDEELAGYYEQEKAKGARVFGLNIAALTGGTNNPSDYFKLMGTDKADNVVLVLFDFTKYQPDLQYETISFTVTLVKEFSNILG